MAAKYRMTHHKCNADIREVDITVINIKEYLKTESKKKSTNNYWRQKQQLEDATNERINTPGRTTLNKLIMKDKERCLPNIHTSLAVVKRLKLMDSGDIHLMGSFPLLAL